MNPTFYTPPEESRPTPAHTPEPSEVRRTFSRLGLGLLVLTAVLMAVAYGIQYAVFFLAPTLLDAWWMTWVINLIPLYAVALPCLYLVFRRVPVAPHNPDYRNAFLISCEKPRFHMGHWLLLLIMGLGCMYAGNLVGSIIMETLSSVTGYDYANALNSIVEDSPTWMVFIGTCICAPFGEELIFRKLLIDRTRGYGDLPAILLSGLLFGLFHGNLFQLFYACLLGMILAYIYTRSGSYLWCVAMHATVNFLGSILLPSIASLVPEDPEATFTGLQILISMLLTAWMFGLIIIAVALICALWHKRKLSPGSTPLPKGRAAALILGNPGMIACIAVMVLLLAVSLIPVGG